MLGKSHRQSDGSLENIRPERERIRVSSISKAATRDNEAAGEDEDDEQIDATSITEPIVVTQYPFEEEEEEEEKEEEKEAAEK